ncbi:hypothetical protein SAMN04487996_11943 [Dyadobacter soli]|uniref:Uncharacterized protein n=1 Tax=Dyadobacter soli TaxID=659014 RepID=A0A1G7UN96_9BACT|nr:hypothetical protein [Dyadobacter soli]SDG48579.1 hypothetical protein SAMN04487996_11943 [Dyadobacter soli]
MKTLLLATLLLRQTDLVNVPLNVASRPVVPEPLVSENVNAQGKLPASYLFPSFVKGTIYFRNGTKRDALVNYHYQVGQMQFLNPRADTLEFTGKYLIDHVEIGERRFVLTDTHSDMEVVGDAGPVLLAARTQPEAVGNSLSHSGQHFSASEGSASHASMVSNQNGNFQWENNASGHSWKVKTSYFLIDKNKIAHPASRRAFLHVYGRNRRQLVRYMRESRIDFENSDDLRKLIGFCAGLTTF